MKTTDEIIINGKILTEHETWLNDNTKGQRANLRHADLQDVNLQGANLLSADLRHADLHNLPILEEKGNEYRI